jgi:hypothetical protein
MDLMPIMTPVPYDLVRRFEIANSSRNVAMESMYADDDETFGSSELRYRSRNDSNYRSVQFAAASTAFSRGVNDYPQKSEARKACQQTGFSKGA